MYFTSAVLVVLVPTVLFHRGNLVLLLGKFSHMISAELNAKILVRKFKSSKGSLSSGESSLDLDLYKRRLQAGCLWTMFELQIYFVWFILSTLVEKILFIIDM